MIRRPPRSPLFPYPPLFRSTVLASGAGGVSAQASPPAATGAVQDCGRSEEHTSELQSHSDLVCRLLLEKKKKDTVKYLDLVSVLQHRVAVVQIVIRSRLQPS